MNRGKLDIQLQWKSEGNQEEADGKLVGRIISNTRIGYVTVRDTVMAAWRVVGNLDVKMIGFNLFTFTFKVPSEANRILKETPWIVRNHILSLQRRKPFLCENEISVNHCEFWVQFHNLPLEGRMNSNIRRMANVVGRVIEVEDIENGRYANRGFGRARVEVEVDKPLIPGFRAPRPEKLGDVWIQVKYEKLMRFCFNCGKLGHEGKMCEDETVEFIANGVHKGYDASLCAQAFRPQMNFQANRAQGRISEQCGGNGEEGSINCRHGHECQTRNTWERGEGTNSQKEANRGMGGILTQGYPTEKEKARGGLHVRELMDVGPTFCVGNCFKLGLDQEAHCKGMGSQNEELNELIRKMDGSENLLRTRREKLKKEQAKYWVELVEEEEDGAKNTGALVPYQNKAIVELAQGIRDVSLKRKAEEQSETPTHKRRKDHDQDLPKSAGDRGRAETELMMLAEEEG